MIGESNADVVCLQEVQCSNLGSVALNSDSLIGRIPKAASDSLIARVLSLLSPLLEANPDYNKRECKLLDILSGKVLEPATTKDCKRLKMFYEEPSTQNVKMVVVKKIKIPIFVDAKQSKGKQGRTAEELLHETVWLKNIAKSDKPVDQRRCDLLRDCNGFKQAVPKGNDYFLLVVIKAGTVCEGCHLDFVLPELPSYSRTRKSITVKRIIDLNYHDESERSRVELQVQGGGKVKGGGKSNEKSKKDGSATKDGAKVKHVGSISVKGSGFESVALIQVLLCPLHASNA
jgi:hypothetical protein